MDPQKAKELKRYTRELLKDHEALRENLAAAEALAAERQADVERLTAEQAAAAAARATEAAEATEEAAPNNYLFGELCRVRERAEPRSADSQPQRSRFAPSRRLGRTNSNWRRTKPARRRIHARARPSRPAGWRPTSSTRATVRSAALACRTAGPGGAQQAACREPRLQLLAPSAL